LPIDDELQDAGATAAKYLELVKRAVLDDLGLEHELRIEYLFEVLDAGGTPDPDRLRDPTRQMRVRAEQLRAERDSGRFRGDERLAPFLPLAIGRARLDAAQRALDVVRREHIPGDVVMLGAGRGGTAIFVQAYLQAWNLTDRTLWVVDRFVPPPDGAADLNAVRDAFSRFDVFAANVRFVQDPTAFGTDAFAAPGVVALLCVDGTSEDTAGPITRLLPRVIAPGFVLLDEPSDALNEFERVDSSALLCQRRKASTEDHQGRPSESVESTCDLSVVVVFYNMRREAARTLHSLSRAYQQGIQDLDYEVIVVENGSKAEQRLDGDYVRSFGPEFRFVDMATTATPSPVGALNTGIGRARGDAIALMIDGAHVLTPGVLHFGMLGLQSYAPAAVATQQWYVGPGQQPQAVLGGYDQAAEDQLFEEIEWPGNGYRLFDIGQFVGDRDWFDGLWESNCLFVPRSLVEQSGPFDPAFSMPGGGYANLELYERLTSSPDITSVTILGEGSFHQVHGGTTTNEPQVDARHGELALYAEHFSALRGQPYRGHGKPTHYVGAMRPNTMRSRSRRRTAANFARPKEREGPDGLPTKPSPIPDDLKSDFIEAFWEAMAWKQTSWLGWKTGKTPTDLFVSQELVSRVRPEWIVETGTGPGGRTLMLASVCDLLGCGQIVSVGPTREGDRPSHPRLTYVDGVPHQPAIAERVSALVDNAPALVILGTRGSRQRILREFELYSPLVPVGSYVVVEDTIVNGHPVWPGFGSGPMEAVKSIVNERAGFASDHELERYGLTFNPGGFLRRVR
jgi:cephalosporin hydroxylase